MATAGAGSTLTDSSKNWDTNLFAGYVVKIVAGTGSGQSRKIASNTATVLTVSNAWATNPGTTSQYIILGEEDLPTAASADGLANPTSQQILTFPHEFNGSTFDRKRSQSSVRTVSAAGTAINTTVTTYNLKDLSIIIEGSAAFASQNLVVAVSQDNSNFVTIDTLNIGTGTSFAKHYSAADKGTTLAVNPLDYPYVKITTPAIGAGNTTTTTIGAK